MVELAKPSDASVRVFTIARVHGVAFGMQSPGLLPTKTEWAEQRSIVNKAVKRLERKGIEADGHVVGTRKSTKRILQEAEFAGCDAIVMGADPDRNRAVADFLWSQEPQRVRRKANKIPGVPGGRRDVRLGAGNPARSHTPLANPTGPDSLEIRPRT